MTMKYVIDSEELMSLWDFEKNNVCGNDPKKLSLGSKKKAWWKCEKGHSYDMYVFTKAKGQGCPYCKNRRILKGYNDLATTRPDLATEWNQAKNGELTPEHIIAGSKKKVWWICQHGHEWQAQVLHRSRGTGCPVCANRTIVKNYNDFGTEHLELLKEWDDTKNEKSPYSYACFARDKVWWICKKGHSFKAAISDRSRGNGCPKCSEELRVSFPEKLLYYYIKKKIENVSANYRADWLGKFELDIFLSDYHIAVEYDGIYGHSTDIGIKRDLRKNEICKENAVLLIRIRENGCPQLHSSSYDYCLANKNDMFSALQFIFQIIQEKTGLPYEILEEEYDVEKDSGAIYSLIDYSDKENSLLNCYPEIAKIWHLDKNRLLKPEYVQAGSCKKVWWLGACGHEWRSTISYEVFSGKCPYCSGKRVLQGFNDLVTTNPSLAEEWDTEKNNNLKPTDYTAGSGKKVWWNCQKGHSWKASIVSRNRGNGCPICSNHKLLTGYNDVASIEELVLDWNYEKNGTMLPEQVCIGSDKKVWWKCSKCNYEWKASVAGRVSGRKCPACADITRRKTYYHSLTEKKGSLKENRPDLMEEWDLEKNSEIIPESITTGYGKKVWWICKKCGHNWSATVISRASGRGCPICGRKNQAEARQETLLKSRPSLTLSHPDLSKEWFYEKNGDLTPDIVTAGSGKRVWWKCIKCGNNWNAAICERTRGRAKCRTCKSSIGS